jgi:hypothetical protein
VNRGSSVGIATGWTVGVRFSTGARDFIFSTVSRWALGLTQHLFNGTGGSFPGSKTLGGVKLAAHLHLLPMSRVIDLYLHPPYELTTWCLINSAETILPFFNFTAKTIS